MLCANVNPGSSSNNQQHFVISLLVQYIYALIDERTTAVRRNGTQRKHICSANLNPGSETPVEVGLLPKSLVQNPAADVELRNASERNHGTGLPSPLKETMLLDATSPLDMMVSIHGHQQLTKV